MGQKETLLMQCWVSYDMTTIVTGGCERGIRGIISLLLSVLLIVPMMSSDFVVSSSRGIFCPGVIFLIIEISVGHILFNFETQCPMAVGHYLV